MYGYCTLFKLMNKRETPSSVSQFKAARTGYRQAVRDMRLRQSIERDTKLDSILSNDPRKLFSYLRSIRKTKTNQY